ncbi:MAG: hypothetical protein IT442_06840 [Phycisphaeraceae bacterium]|nr:hypothetical protein [Phycisphaeraceae bacterium]
MNAEIVYQTWAPKDSPWSVWAKPVLFAAMGRGHGYALSMSPWPALPAGDLSWAEDRLGDTGVVVNLDGTDAVRKGLALMEKGYRPVPVFNGAPSYDSPEVRGVRPVIEALLAGTVKVAEEAEKLAPGAPPAFLIDSRRTRADVASQPGMFDNRWIVFPQDFPSATYLRSAGISRMVVVQHGTWELTEDLRHVLLRWQEGGVRIEVWRTDVPPPPREVQVRRPRGFRWMWARLLMMLAYRVNAAGGFGSRIPYQNQGGGYGGGYGGFG